MWKKSEKKLGYMKYFSYISSVIDWYDDKTVKKFVPSDSIRGNIRAWCSNVTTSVEVFLSRFLTFIRKSLGGYVFFLFLILFYPYMDIHRREKHQKCLKKSKKMLGYMDFFSYIYIVNDWWLRKNSSQSDLSLVDIGGRQ